MLVYLTHSCATGDLAAARVSSYWASPRVLHVGAATSPQSELVDDVIRRVLALCHPPEAHRSALLLELVCGSRSVSPFRDAQNNNDLCRVYAATSTVSPCGDSLVDFDRNHDARVRTAAFDWLARQISLHGDVLPRSALAQGFELDQRCVPMVGPQGIFKPALMQVPLSITAAPKGPYDDAIGPDNLLRYRYRGTDPHHRDNVGLRFAMHNSLPLAYFHGIVPGRYLVMWPVYVVGDAPEDLAFAIALDDAIQSGLFPENQEPLGTGAEIRREYVMSFARRRLHQRAFRERVLRAYRHQCALCRLRHSELLDAAHILPDAEPEGEPVVRNGLALCRLHHAAFDRFFLAVRPDRIIEVRADVLEEVDGPTLRHAIQGLHGEPIVLPTKIVEQPAPEFLAERYERFLVVATTR